MKVGSVQIERDSAHCNSTSLLLQGWRSCAGTAEQGLPWHFSSRVCKGFVPVGRDLRLAR